MGSNGAGWMKLQLGERGEIAGSVQWGRCHKPCLTVILVEAKTQLGFRYASISTEFFVLLFVSNHNGWVLASTIA
jgi:hypothetical protein